MPAESSPEEWHAPEWHEDYGDIRIEFEELRSLASAICRSISGVRLQLEQPEAGLMELVINLPNQETVEIHSVTNSCGAISRRFAIFVSPGTMHEIEHYSNTVADALEFITQRLSCDS